PLSNLIVVDSAAQSLDYVSWRLRQRLVALQVLADGADALVACTVSRREMARDGEDSVYRSAMIAAARQVSEAKALDLCLSPGLAVGWFSSMLMPEVLRVRGPQPKGTGGALVSLGVSRLWRSMDESLSRGAAVKTIIDLNAASPASASADVTFFGRTLGVLEDCGCKGPAYGGLARVVAHVWCPAAARGSGSLMVGLGSYFAPPESPRFDDSGVEATIELLGMLRPLSFLNYAVIDLYAKVVAGNVEDWSLNCITCNVIARESEAELGSARAVD